ncbi:MAG: hypothetical protein A4E45_00450 [Methanosaeta sp. PtaB.Bin039]|nr:MAG: hypothetical protein A4E45_00450 [Methanosaeta sp. PtaB.Bin039]OPY47011.1 MAG: hypothetical protein A4E47_00404 [Methanosaeta sp. PtaU1.Bin028]HOT07065.1 hypothetical protein [Methanotrichaceae archaeon]HQF17100.1 hypothetical protein [Methanotrichaceae archaeon]HQI91721.1 hypothetical protein [Methanotrichaceae archaeon]
MRKIRTLLILALLAGVTALATGVIGGSDYLRGVSSESIFGGIQWSLDRGAQGLTYLNRYLADNLSDEVVQANQALMDLGAKAYLAAKKMVAQGESVVRKALQRDLISGLALPSWPSWSAPTWTDVAWPHLGWPKIGNPLDTLNNKSPFEMGGKTSP